MKNYIKLTLAAIALFGLIGLAQMGGVPPPQAKPVGGPGKFCICAIPSSQLTEQEKRSNINETRSPWVDVGVSCAAACASRTDRFTGWTGEER